MAAHGGDAEPTGLIRSVSRALRIIERVAASPRPVPVKVIARQCELNLATAYHLVRTLCYEGYLVRLASGESTSSRAAPGYCLATGSPQIGKELDCCGSIVAHGSRGVKNSICGESNTLSEL